MYIRRGSDRYNILEWCSDETNNVVVVVVDTFSFLLFFLVDEVSLFFP